MSKNATICGSKSCKFSEAHFAVTATSNFDPNTHFVCRYDGFHAGNRYVLYPHPVNVTQAVTKCHREGGELAAGADLSSLRFFQNTMHRYYKLSLGGTASALLAIHNEPSTNCMMIHAGSRRSERPCSSRGVPICRMNVYM